MFSSILSTDSSFFKYENHSINNIYHKFHNLFGREEEAIVMKTNDMLSSRANTVTSDESFLTPVSSVGDLIALSPQRITEFSEQPDVISDLLTGSPYESDSVCDIKMQEVPMYHTFIDIFIDANSLDYLVKCAESNRQHNLIDRGKESLFVKFDPLYAKPILHTTDSSEQNLLMHPSEQDTGYETSSTTSILTDNITETSQNSLSAGTTLSKCGKEKPTQVVPPVISADLPKASTTQTKPPPPLICSVSANLTSSHVATDRLISISGSTPPTAAPRSPRNKHYGAPEVDRLQSLRVILQNQDQEVLQLRQENRELKSSLQDIQHNFSRTKNDMENKIEKLIDERDILLDRECKLIQQVNDKTLSNKQMCIVMEEYEKTISSIIDEQQKEKIKLQEALENLAQERDQALNHLSNMESSFNDLLAKYEKCKSLILESKNRETVLNLKINEYEVGMQKYEELYNNLKRITEENLDKANETLENIKKAHNVEITKMNATIKKHEIMISSLQESLAQKTRDNEELTRICDQLIKHVH